MREATLVGGRAARIDPGRGAVRRHAQRVRQQVVEDLLDGPGRREHRPRTATPPRRPASPAPAEDWAHAEASSTPMPGPTAEWSYLDTRPFSNDYATP
ncbi:hypothetical protein [Streptomyces sp. GbtcB7]|uniref:hypothetical protein n=1 Tax=Streptomyces sp. GbtcB7 TaxID=2824752 RepID=UPI001C2FC483|nr:hypothetical protein [Streptomyces sp. GbtcB7]